MEEFGLYQPLFNDAIENNRMGICRWIESGTSLDTALPELTSMVEDKEEWRAIIIRNVDDVDMSFCESKPENPYDFIINAEETKDWKESTVPLIRLTQMLGGVPQIEPHFQPELLKEKHKAVRTVYKPFIDDDEKKARDELQEKYSQSLNMPSSIILVSVRRDNTNNEDTLAPTWLNRDENDSSSFWHRNRYPSICRFLVFDYADQGAVRKEKDDFTFWLSVMLLTNNEINASFLQGYRLYKLNTVIDREDMETAMQRYVNRLRDIKKTVENRIRRAGSNYDGDTETLPDYRETIPVILNNGDPYKQTVKTSSFGWLSYGSGTDINNWNEKKRQAETAITDSVEKAERILDKSADTVRSKCVYTEEEVVPLNKYQEEDILKETDESYKKIVRLQGSLPSRNIYDNPEIAGISEKIKNLLLSRVTSRPAIWVLTLAMGLFIISVIPAIIKFFTESSGNLIVPGVMVLVGFFFAFIAAMIIILIQKGKLNKLIRSYNNGILDTFNKLQTKAGDYTEYMSEITSYSRAMSYYNISMQKKHELELERDEKYLHLRSLNIMLNKVREWGRAFNLALDFHMVRQDNYVDIDVTIPPAANKAYAIDISNNYEAELNNSGMTISSPFDFVRRIEIIREELYDD